MARLSSSQIDQALYLLTYRKEPGSTEDLSAHAFHLLRLKWSDRAPFIVSQLLEKVSSPTTPLPIKKTVLSLLIRAGIRQGFIGPTLSQEKRDQNRLIARENLFLENQKIQAADTPEIIESKIEHVKTWFLSHKTLYPQPFSTKQKWKTFFLDTRFCCYFSRILTLDFGTLRSDTNKTVISEVTKRLKYSLTLAVIPLVITFVLCILFGLWMAVYPGSWGDTSLNLVFLILFALPVFVVAPFLIEKVALTHHIPFSHTPFPLGGFHSPSEIYNGMTSWDRLKDVSIHLILPLTAILYGSLAVQSRLARTAFLECLKQDYVRTARAKGLPRPTILFKHVGRNASITIVTSLAASLGVVLGGSLIVETVFEINGFGRFFYDAVINRDYHVVLFSALAGSFLSLIGYLLADLSYTFLDPRLIINE